MNKIIAEFIGTFFLVLTVGCTVIPGAAGVIPPLAIGAAPSFLLQYVIQQILKKRARAPR